jgi:hypothetical protein
MRGDISTGVKSLATRSPSPRDVVSRDYPEQVPRGLECSKNQADPWLWACSEDVTSLTRANPKIHGADRTDLSARE